MNPGFFYYDFLTKMNRVLFLIDGFNVYHALDEKQEYHKYKWIDYFALARCFVTRNDKIIDVILFTAYVRWNTDKKLRHKKLTQALESRGVKIALGKFKPTTKRCRICKRIYETYEEKHTDVNIAIRLFQYAMDDAYDTVMIVTADSDLVPAVRAVRDRFPGKRIVLITPVGRSSKELGKLCKRRMRMKRKHLESSQLPDIVVIDRKRGITVERPASWR